MINFSKTLAAGLLCLTSIATSAKTGSESNDDNREDKPLFVQPMAGVSYTLGEGPFGNMLSPTISLNAGYNFSRWWAARINLGGWEAKGDAMYDYTHHTYSFNYLQLSAEAVVNWSSYIWNDNRRYAGYAFIGLGCNWRFSNSEAHEIARKGYPFAYLWNGTKGCLAGTGGLGGRYALTESLGLNAEIGVAGMTDHFNSKHGHHNNIDWIFNLSVGVSYNFGQRRENSFIPNF